MLRKPQHAETSGAYFPASMTQKVIIGNATLYCGDAMEVLPTLSGVHLCASDPPYRITAGGPSGLTGGIFDPAKYNNDGGIVPCSVEWSDWPPLLFAALADDADIYIMANDKNVIAAGVALLAAGFEQHNLLAWDKITATPNRWYMKNLEFTLYFWKGRARMIRDPSCKQLIRLPHKDVSNHPTEKPVALMESYIVNSSHVGETVLDMFMGSGTTGVAAIRTRRHFIGIERDQRFFDMACDRITTAKAQGQLFEQMPKQQAALSFFESSVGKISTRAGEP